jgi:hypothetical protein
LVIAVLALAVLAARPVSGAGPVITTEPFGGTIPVVEDCGAFQVRADFTGERRFIRFYDDAGTLLREIRHISFAGTLTNTTSGAVIPYQGHFTRTFDAVAHTIMFTGLRVQTIVPGQGAIVVAAGNEFVIVADAPADELVTVHGRLDLAEQVCAALA